MWTMNFQMFKLDLEKAEEPGISCQNHWIIEKAGQFQKTCTSALLTTPRPLIIWITTNCGKFIFFFGKFLKRCDQTTWPAWEIYMQVRKQQLYLDMEQQITSKPGKKYVQAVYCHLACLTYMRGTSLKCQAGWSTHWNQDCWEKYQ